MIQIHWTNIKKDVDKRTWALANVRIEDAELKDNAQTDEKKGSVMLIMRFAEEAVALISNEILNKLVRSAVEEPVTDSIDADLLMWTFPLKEGVNVNEDALCMIIHKCVVDYIMFKWAGIYSANESKVFEAEYKSCLMDIVKAVFALGTPRKKKRQIPVEENETTIEYV